MTQNPLRFTDVFVPGGFPRHTYNPRLGLDLESRLLEAKENLCKLVVITGQTKSGKTVLSRQIFPREECCWIDGGTISSEDDIWNIIIEQLDIFTGKESMIGNNTQYGISAKTSAEANFLVLKGQGEVQPSIEQGQQKSTTTSRDISPKIAALKALKETNTPIVIDDFHYLASELQGTVVRALKPLIFDGLPVVIIAIPHRRYDAMKVEREMTGRIHQIQIPAWPEEELSFIPLTGFRILEQDMISNDIISLAQQAIGSPHLMQEFCRSVCKSIGMGKQPKQFSLISIGMVGLIPVFEDVAETIGRPIFEKLARGPRQRTDRMERGLKNGDKVDIYELVLHALAHLRPGLIGIEYEELRSTIGEVTSTPLPQLHEISRVLKHMSSIAATDQSSTPVVDFDDSDKKLHITDPFFAFYLRWGALSH